MLKLKTTDFAIRTRAGRLPSPTVLPDRLFEAASTLLLREANGTAFRLIGIGANPLLPLADADHGDLADIDTPRRAAAQAAIDALRQRFGEAAISRGAWLETAPDQASGGAAAIGISRASGWSPVPGARSRLPRLRRRRAAVLAYRDGAGRCCRRSAAVCCAAWFIAFRMRK